MTRAMAAELDRKANQAWAKARAYRLRREDQKAAEAQCEAVALDKQAARAWREAQA